MPPGNRIITAIVVTTKVPTISILIVQILGPGSKPVRPNPARDDRLQDRGCGRA
jgi:hypothetical protein